MTRRRNPETLRIRDELRQLCKRCGESFGVHGAAPPHTRENCDGFVAATKEQP